MDNLRGKTVWLPCSAQNGMFSNEKLVHVPAGGCECIGFVDTELISEGKIRTRIWDVRGDLVDVVLPGTFDHHLVAVKRSELKLLDREYAV